MSSLIAVFSLFANLDPELRTACRFASETRRALPRFSSAVA